MFYKKIVRLFLRKDRLWTIASTLEQNDKVFKINEIIIVVRVMVLEETIYPINETRASPLFFTSNPPTLDSFFAEPAISCERIFASCAFSMPIWCSVPKSRMSIQCLQTFVALGSRQLFLLTKRVISHAALTYFYLFCSFK